MSVMAPEVQKQKEEPVPLRNTGSAASGTNKGDVFHSDPGKHPSKAELVEGPRTHTRSGVFYVRGDFPPDDPNRWPEQGALREKVVERVKLSYVEVPPSPDHPDIASSQALLDSLLSHMESMNPDVRKDARMYGEKLIKRYDKYVEHEPILAPSEEVSGYERQISYSATAACYHIANDIMTARERNSGDDRGLNTMLEAYELLLLADWIHERSLEALGKQNGDRLDDSARDFFLTGEQAYYDEIVKIKEKILGTDPESRARQARSFETALGHTAAWIADFQEDVDNDPGREQAFNHLSIEVRADYVDQVGRVLDWIDQQRELTGTLPKREDAHAQLDDAGLMDAVDRLYNGLESVEDSAVDDFASKVRVVAQWVRDYSASGHKTPSREATRAKLDELNILHKLDLDNAVTEYYRMVTREKIDRAMFDRIYDDLSSPMAVLRVQQNYMYDMRQIIDWMAENNTGDRPNRRDAHTQFDDMGLGAIVDELYDEIAERQRVAKALEPDLVEVRAWMRDYHDEFGEWPSRDKADKRLVKRLQPAVDIIYDGKGTSNIELAQDHRSDMQAVAGWVKSYSQRHGRVPSRTTAHSHLNERGLSDTVDAFYRNTTAYHARQLASAAR